MTWIPIGSKQENLREAIAQGFYWHEKFWDEKKQQEEPKLGEVGSVATAVQIVIGFQSITGLRHPDGTFGVPVSHVIEQFAISHVHEDTTRDPRGYLGKNPLLPDLPEWSSDINPIPEKVLTLAQYDEAVMKMAFGGNPKAQAFLLSMAGLGTQQLFLNAFDGFNKTD